MLRTGIPVLVALGALIVAPAALAEPKAAPAAPGLVVEAVRGPTGLVSGESEDALPEGRRNRRGEMGEILKQRRQGRWAQPGGGELIAPLSFP
jgi:hypothetical protein